MITTKHIPDFIFQAPLEIRTIEIDTSPNIICEEILALSKMNWKQYQFDGKFPITIACARKVGEIMKYLQETDKTANSLCILYVKGQTANRRLAQCRVMLIEHYTSHQLLWCIDIFVPRNPPLRQAPNRPSGGCENDHTNKEKATCYIKSNLYFLYI